MTLIRKWWPWILGAVILVICGMIAGWKLAGLLTLGLGGGVAAKQLGVFGAGGCRLEQERQSLEDRARETDAMIDDYYRKKRGG